MVIIHSIVAYIYSLLFAISLANQKCDSLFIFKNLAVFRDKYISLRLDNYISYTF